MKNTYHRDGTVTYWAVYAQQWVSHATEIPDQELAAMSATERARVLRHLGRGAVGGTLTGHWRQ